MTDGIDVDKLAETAERLGLVTPDLQGPDEPTDEIVVIINVHGGLVQDVGARRADIPKLRVIVVDHDNIKAGDEGGYTEVVTALEDWGRGSDDSLPLAADELPDALREELGL